MFLRRISVWLYGAVAIFCSACAGEPTMVPGARPYILNIPNHFPAYTPSTDNPLTVEGVELGRKLFFDTRLSSNNKISCATCHLPQKAFTDGEALSTAGVAGTALLRHAPPLFNLLWASNGLFWDGGSTNLESQAFAPLAAHDEMNQNLFELIDELAADPEYPLQFRRSFNDSISSAGIVKALAQFQRTLVSAGSRYDAWAAGAVNALSETEKAGLQVFEQNCGSCHQPPLFTDNLFHNNGLSDSFTDESHERIYMGRFRISFDAADIGKFKTPSLRNLAFTAPYMHDGRMATVDAVLEHYVSGVKGSPTLDPSLKSGIPLTEAEKLQLKSFLLTLTDSGFVKRPEFQNPFH